MDWSYALLDEAESVMLTELAVFQGTFSLLGAKAVTSHGDHVLELVSSLVAQSLVVPLPEMGRYRLLETVRLYALDKLVERGAAQALRQRHLEWVLSFCGPEVLVDPEPQKTIEIITLQLAERQSYFAAISWVETHDQMDTVAALLCGAWPTVVVGSEALEFVRDILDQRDGWGLPYGTSSLVFLLGAMSIHGGDEDGARSIATVLHHIETQTDASDATNFRWLLERDSGAAADRDRDAHGSGTGDCELLHRQG